ncbi:MAG: dynamin family protein, partial [Planctomycetota bacterium]
YQQLLRITANEIFDGQFEGPISLEKIEKNTRLIEGEKNLLRNLAQYTENLKNSRFLLGVLGRFKSGKSTLLNVLAGENLSPVNVRVSTGVLVYFSKSNQTECKVAFLDGTEKIISIEEVPLYVSDQHNPENQKKVLRVHHESPQMNLEPNIIYVDTPGLAAVSSVHDDITLDFTQHCSAAMVVSGFPPFGQEELRFYQRIQQSIPHVFLIQNLPEDKFKDWIALECQTILHLFRMNFYPIKLEEVSKLEQRLRMIDTKTSEEDLLKLKSEYDIKLFSVCARDAAIEGNPTQKYFLNFKSALYQFLNEDRGKILLEGYKKKGENLLNSISHLVLKQQELLQKSLQDLEKAIAENQQEQQKALKEQEAIINKAKVSFQDVFREFKLQVLDKELNATVKEILNNYGDINEFRISKSQKEAISQRLSQFSSKIDDLYRQLLNELEKRVTTAQTQVQENLTHHCMFHMIGPDRMKPFSKMETREMIGVHSIDVAVDRGIAVAMTLLAGSLSGNLIGVTGTGFISSALGLLGVGAAAGPVGFLIGAGIGLGLSFPTLKFLNPVLDPVRGIFAKFFGDKLSEVLPKQITPMVQIRIEEAERALIQPLSEKFCKEVEENYRLYFEFANKTLETLLTKKREGKEQEEVKRYGRIMTLLKGLEHKFAPFTTSTPEDSQSKGKFWQKVKGMLNNRTK